MTNLKNKSNCYLEGVSGFLFMLLSLLLLQVFNASAQRGDVVPVHDPVIIKQDSVYYIFSTGTGIPIRRSKDLVNWEYIGQVFDTPQPWAVKKFPGYTGHISAPDIFYDNGTYYLYYSITKFGKNTSVIAVATNKTLHPEDPNYKWIDHGIVLESVPNRDDWNALDVNIVRDENGEVWMAFGSFWSGIKIVKLAPDLLSIKKYPQEWYPLARRPRLAGTPDWHSGEAAIEAPFIVHKNGYWYLFVSFDYCCRGVNSNYKIMVGRSKNLLGPYVDRDGTPMMESGGTLVLAGDKRWPGRGHNAVLFDKDKDWLVYHAYDANNGGARTLRIRRLLWDKEGWPVAGKVITEDEER